MPISATSASPKFHARNLVLRDLDRESFCFVEWFRSMASARERCKGQASFSHQWSNAIKVESPQRDRDKRS